MICPTWQQILDGSQTQMRVVVKPNEDYDPIFDAVSWGADYRTAPRIKYYPGQTLAVQPGFGQKQVGRIRIIAIRKEHLQEISEEDALAEGCDYRMYDYVRSYDISGGPIADVGYDTPVEVYTERWQDNHTKPGTRWADNPVVWVLDFELVQGKECES